MRKQDIEIKILPDGKVEYVIKGVKGASCFQETAFLDAALGNAVTDEQKTSEFYEQSEGYGSVTVGEGSDE